MKKITQFFLVSGLLLSLGLVSQSVQAASSTTESEVGITFEGTMPIVQEDPPDLPVPNEPEPNPQDPLIEEPIEYPIQEPNKPQENPGKPNLPGTSTSYPSKLPQTGKVNGSELGVGTLLLGLGLMGWMTQTKLKKEAVHEMQKNTTV